MRVVVKDGSPGFVARMGNQLLGKVGGGNRFVRRNI